MTPAAPHTERSAPGATHLISIEADPAVRIAFTGRGAPDGAEANLSLLVGDGDVAAARRTALAQVGADERSAVFMQQVHGGGVAAVTADDAGRGTTDHATAVAGVDAMVTTRADLALVVLVADCVPVVLVAPQHGVGVVHAGRGGVMADVAAAAVGRLNPPAPEQVVAVIGPAIGGCCYEVPPALADEVAGAVPAARATTTWGTPSLDLPAAVEGQLRAAGVRQVRRVGGCTRCNADRYFSHRAATAGVAAPGRQAAIVVRAAAAEGRDAPAWSARRGSLESPASR